MVSFTYLNMKCVMVGNLNKESCIYTFALVFSRPLVKAMGSTRTNFQHVNFSVDVWAPRFKQLSRRSNEIRVVSQGIRGRYGIFKPKASVPLHWHFPCFISFKNGLMLFCILIVRMKKKKKSKRHNIMK